MTGAVPAREISVAAERNRDYGSVITMVGDIFCALIGDNVRLGYFTDGQTARSPAGTDYIDLKIGGHWWRLNLDPIAEPVSLEAHNHGI